MALCGDLPAFQSVFKASGGGSSSQTQYTDTDTAWKQELTQVGCKVACRLTATVAQATQA